MVNEWELSGYWEWLESSESSESLESLESLDVEIGGGDVESFVDVRGGWGEKAGDVEDGKSAKGVGACAYSMPETVVWRQTTRPVKLWDVCSDLLA